MIESDATRLRKIKAVGGVLVSHNAGEFWAVFDRESTLIIDGVEARVPVLEARSCDVVDLPKETVLDVSDNPKLGVPGGQFRIKRHEPGGTGWTIVILKR